MNNKWNNRFMDLAKLVASWSEDKSRKTGAVIVGPDNEVLSVGYNGFPRGIEHRYDRFERPAKYTWTEHAERNAIYNAARQGIRLHALKELQSARIYIPWYPCADCARAIIQSGIGEIICYAPDFSDPKWGPDFKVVYEMLREANVFTTIMEGSMGEAK